MKTKILIFIAFCIVCLSIVNSQKALAYSSQNPEDTIRVFCSPDLFELTSNWVAKYSSINQGTKIKAFQIQDDKADNLITSESNIYFLSNDNYKNQNIWKMIVGVDAIVPIFNSKNPFVNEIMSKGVSSEKMAQLFKSNTCNWGSLLNSSFNNPVSFYTFNNELFKTDIANYLNIDASKIVGINLKNEDELISAIQKDRYAIGFCKVASVLDSKNNGAMQGVDLLPIDKNNNGKIDNNEKIYNDLNAFLRGVWIGKYPKELCKNIYSVTSVKPSNDNAVAFLAWVVTDGQQYLNTNGFCDLPSNVIKSNLDNLYVKDDFVKTPTSWSVIPVAAIVLVVCIALFLIIDFVVQRMKGSRSIVPDIVIDSPPFFDDNSIVVPDGLYFDKSHTWAFMEKDGVVGIGIDDFLQNITGPITRVKMKENGENVKKGDPFLTLIQEGKQLIIRAPLSGIIKAQNKNLISNSLLINKSPYSDGWIYRIEPTNWMRDIQFLIFAQGYKEWLKMEFMHLRDFFAVAVRPDFADKTHIVLQDGGVIRKGVLKDLKPEVWEDFQTYFLDSPK